SLEIAQVLGTREGHVHRPDEDGTVPLFEYLVEPGVVPQPGTDPHEAQALVGGTADSCFHPFANLVPEPARMLDGPVRAAMPLRDHRVRHLLPDGHGARPRASDQPGCLGDVLLLLVDAFHERRESIAIESP